MSDKQRFEELLKIPAASIRMSAGVGTLSEKYLHAFLKVYFEPDAGCREVKVGRFTADICRGRQITEIQTRSLDKLREKLSYYLSEGYSVRVVFPAAHEKQIVWIDPDTGEIVSRRRSNKHFEYCDCFWELYKIKEFLSERDVSVCLMLIDVDEIRTLDGYGRSRKKRATKVDIIPRSLYGCADLGCLRDYEMFLPNSLGETFGVREYAGAVGTSEENARSGLKILCSVGAVQMCGKEGRRYLYRRTF